MTDRNEQVEQQKVDPHQHTRRDAETQMALGAFVSFISIFVLIGTFWADDTKAIVVNMIAGSVLLGIGVVMALLGFTKWKNLVS